MDLIPGYTLDETIFRGGVTSVYRLRDNGGRTAIFKTHTAAYPASRWLARLRHEVEILALLKRVDGVVQARDIARHGERYGLFLHDDGAADLRRLIDGGALSIWQQLHVALDVARVLARVHARGVIHKDVNPRNIIVSSDGVRTTLIDFGLASILPREHSALRPDQLEGSLPYLAPEQTGRTNRRIDHRSDLYALGIVLYEIVTGRVPFEAGDAVGYVHAHVARTAPAPHEIDPQIPYPLSAVIMKLLRKAPEERYQDALGLVADLEIIAQASRDGADGVDIVLAESLGDFVPGRHDRACGLQISEVLYGRESQVADMLAALERAANGSAELLLIKGNSGIGKTSLVREVHAPLVRKRGYFVAGKFEQLQRDIPYRALAAALGDLIRQFLTEPEEVVAHCRERLLAAFDHTGQIVTDLVPEVEYLLGPQPEVPALGPQERKKRLHRALLALVHTTVSPQRPLVLFIDDLQWADAGSLELIALILTDPAARNLLVIGAYRDNEVSAGHRLMHTLRDIRAAGGRVSTSELDALDTDDVAALLRDTLHMPAEAVRDLAETFHGITEGNPLFVRELLEAAYEEGLLWYERDSGAAAARWQWNLRDLRRITVSDNVVGFLLGRMERLAACDRRALSYAAAIGVRFALSTVAAVMEISSGQAARRLRSALEQDLLVIAAGQEQVLIAASASDADQADDIGAAELGPADASCDVELRFRHDRVQQAAYALIEPTRQAAIHRDIGLYLFQRYDAGTRPQYLFETLNHLNRAELDDKTIAPELRLRVAHCQLQAGKKAMASGAYHSALTYLQAGIGLLDDAVWQQDHAFVLDLHRNGAQSAMLTGDFATCDQLVDQALERTGEPIERAGLLGIRISRCSLASAYDEAIVSGRRALADLGIDIPAPDDLSAQLEHEWARFNNALAGRPMATLQTLTEVDDPVRCMAMQTLKSIAPASAFIDLQIAGWVSLRLMNTCIQQGNFPGVSYVYAIGAFMFVWWRHEYAAANQLADVALELARCGNVPGELARASLGILIQVRHWKHPLPAIDSAMRAAMADCLEMGNYEVYGYFIMSWLCNRIHAGEPLAEVQPGIDDALAFCARTKHTQMVDELCVMQSAVACLLGESAAPPSLDVPARSEQSLLDQLAAHHSHHARGRYHLFAAQIHYLFGQWDTALTHARAATRREWLVGTQLAAPRNLFYWTLALLARAICAHTAGFDRPGAEYRQIAAHMDTFAGWAEANPEVFGHANCLLRAERAWLDGRYWPALRAYQEARARADEHGYLQDRALIHERLGRFWLAQGEQFEAHQQMRHACVAYAAWGARAKVTQLAGEFSLDIQEQIQLTPDTEVTHVTVLEDRSVSSPLDAESLFKATQAISSNLQLDELRSRLLAIVVENGGAERGCLLQPRGEDWYLVGEIEAAGVGTFVAPERPLQRCGDRVPLAVINYVRRSGKQVRMDDIERNDLFAADAYVRDCAPRSILCLPICGQEQVLGILYLEHRGITGAFSTQRGASLTILASQAAIALDNAKLYGDLQALNTQLEERVRERTAQLEAAQAQLVQRAYQEGMAEIASDVMHSIGNTANTVRVTTDLMRQTVDRSVLRSYRKAAGLLEEHMHDLASFFTHDPRSQQLAAFFVKLGVAFGGENNDLRENLDILAQQVQTIEAIVRAQQAYVTEQRECEPLCLGELVADTIVLRSESLEREGLVVATALDTELTIVGHRSKLIDVFLNLCKNAEEATAGQTDARISIEVSGDREHVYARVRDNGVGVAAADLEQVFRQGFTTKPQGYGMGLHRSANYIGAIGGHISLHSAGKGMGAEAVIRLPRADQTASP